MSIEVTSDETRVMAFLERVVDEIGAALNVPMTVIGDRLGLYRAMADGAPVAPAELAERTGTHERYVREWLAGQAAGGYVAHDPDTGTYSLPPEHAAVLADEQSPFYQGGLFQSASAAIHAQDEVTTRFRSGDGLGWHQHHHDVFEGVGRMFGVSYRTFLVEEWIPALDGVDAKLRQGALVADVGCGLGISTALLAQAYPESRFVGFDYHEASLEQARRNAEEAGVAHRVDFRAATATDFPGTDYDLIACFDALHDMGDPQAAARHIHAALAADGTWLIVEPNAGDAVAENLHPIGRLQYGYSVLVCTPGSLSQPGRAALGTAAGQARLSEAILGGGFHEVRRVAETPFNMVLEAKP
jgi:2-polyprenyl-3-methyl-5-hydroxy-6-metoxy-1,4-benzoquinol methylase